MIDANSHDVTCLLRDIESHLYHIREHTTKQPFIDEIVTIAPSHPWLLDYKGYKYVYVYSASALTLQAEDTGTVSVVANTWSLINLGPGQRLTNIANTTAIFLVRCCDDAYTLSISGGNVNINTIGGQAITPLPLGQAAMVNSIPVAIAGDQSPLSVQHNYYKTGLLSLSASGTLLAVLDVSYFRDFSLTVFGTWTGSLTVQGTNDPLALSNPSAAAWTSVVMSDLVNGGGFFTITTSATYMPSASLNFNYLRVVYAAGTGTVQAYGFFTSFANQKFAMNAIKQGTWNVGAQEQRYDGAAYQNYRYLTTFKTATATAAGNTAVWTPTTGKKFRLMAYAIDITNDCALAAAADLDITFQDAAVAIPGIGVSTFVPNAAGTVAGSFTTGWHFLDNGILSAVANNVLNINLSAALTSGKARVRVAGIEE